MKFGSCQLQSRAFCGLVEGEQVSELDGSPFTGWKSAGNVHLVRSPSRTR